MMDLYDDDEVVDGHHHDEKRICVTCRYARKVTAPGQTPIICLMCLERVPDGQAEKLRCYHWTTRETIG